MTTAERRIWRTELKQRRERLQEALQSPAADASLSQWLTEVDTALEPNRSRNLWALRDVPRHIESGALDCRSFGAVLSGPSYERRTACLGERSSLAASIQRGLYQTRLGA